MRIMDAKRIAIILTSKLAHMTSFVAEKATEPAVILALGAFHSDHVVQRLAAATTISLVCSNFHTKTEDCKAISVTLAAIMMQPNQPLEQALCVIGAYFLPTFPENGAASQSVVKDWWNTDDVALEFQSENPKQAGSQAWGRYEKYKSSRTVGEAKAAGATAADLKSDLGRDVVRLLDISMHDRAKRFGNTPDGNHRKRAAGPNVAKDALDAAALVPVELADTRTLDFDGEDADIKPNSEAEQRMLLAMERMMTRTFQSNIAGMEHRLMATMAATVRDVEASIGNLRDELAAERLTRESVVRDLEAQMRNLKDQVLANEAKIDQTSIRNTRSSNEPANVSDRDDPVLVVGGFGKMPKAKALETVQTALDDTPGFVEAFARGDLPKVVFAKFDSHEAKNDFLRGQKDAEAFQLSGLHASKNRPPTERKWQRALNKVKRAICEVSGQDGSNIILDRETREVYDSSADTLTLLAKVTLAADVKWEDCVGEATRARQKELMAQRE